MLASEPHFLHTTRALRLAKRFLFVGLCCLLPLSLAAQQRPLVTQEVETIASGELLVQFGFEFLQGVRFPLAGLEGDVTRVGVVAFQFGVSPRVEIQFDGTIRNFLAVSDQQPAFVAPILSQGGSSTDDVGDFSLAAKVKLFPEQGRRPAFGFRFGFEMPTSDERRGIGLNTTNVFSTLLVQKHLRRVNTFGHIGLAILQAPAGLFTQNDVLLLGGGFLIPLNERINLVGEVQGGKSTRPTPATSPLVGTGSRGQVRLGFQIFAGGFRWDVAGIAGLTKDDADTGITVGLSKTIKLTRR